MKKKTSRKAPYRDDNENKLRNNISSARTANGRLIQIIMQDFYESQGPASVPLIVGEERGVVILTGSFISFILTTDFVIQKRIC